jgi:hypothetical protein
MTVLHVEDGSPPNMRGDSGVGFMPQESALVKAVSPAHVREGMIEVVGTG